MIPKPPYCPLPPPREASSPAPNTPRPRHFLPLFTAHWIYTFSAKERDSETGLSYFGSRYYSSDLSIWLSVDPMSDKYASLSPYVYCADNPLKLVDPNGEEVVEGKPPWKLAQLLSNIESKLEGSADNRQFEGHSDGANRASDVPEWMKNGAQAVVSVVPGISEINDAKTVITKKDIYGNEASKTDVNIAKASLITCGGLSLAKKGAAAIAKTTTSKTTKTRAVAAAKVSDVSTKVAQRASKIYTAVKLFIRHSDNGKKKSSNER